MAICVMRSLGNSKSKSDLILVLLVHCPFTVKYSLSTLFSGLDLQMKAVKHLIYNTVQSDFDQEKGGYPTKRKMFALYLNELGLYRASREL
jgi:hypothetical protein